MYAHLYKCLCILLQLHHMVEDVVRELGFLCLGSRLKRIGERLQADVQQMLDKLDIPVQSSQLPALAAIDRLGPLTIGELAEAIGITQPGVTRIVAQLADDGLLNTQQPTDDQRRRLVSLTKKGRRLVDASKRELWPEIEGAVASICGHLEGPLLEQLASIEEDLKAIPLHRRVASPQRQKDEQTPA
jgi:DNA-binding MarR family transcriptional regulator